MTKPVKQKDKKPPKVTTKKKAPATEVLPMCESEELTFGKFKGEKLGDVPAWWLIWCHEQPSMKKSRPELYAYIEYNIKHITEEYERDRLDRFHGETEEW